MVLIQKLVDFVGTKSILVYQSLIIYNLWEPEMVLIPEKRDSSENLIYSIFCSQLPPTHNL